MRIYVGNLSSRAEERDLEKFFKGYGRLGEVIIKSGFAFIDIDSERDAEDAVHDLNGKELLGHRVSVEFSRKPRGGFGGGGGRGGPRDGGPYSTKFKVIVDNVSSRCGWQDLKDFMSKGGQVTFAGCHRTRTGEGEVCFYSYDDMKKAIKKLDGTELMGKSVKMTSAYRGDSRSRSRSRSRGRDRRRSRSDSRSRSRSPRKTRKSASDSRSRSRSASRSRSKS